MTLISAMLAAVTVAFGLSASSASAHSVSSVRAHPPPLRLSAAKFKALTAPLPVRRVQTVAGGDEIVDGRGDSNGWHIYAASSGGGWVWHPLATLAPAGVNPGGERWIGRQCITGDGRFVVAVVAPWSANNSPSGLDRGGIAYVINAHSGAVRPLTAGVSLYYFTPSCGPGRSVALTGFAGPDERRTTLLLADAATATIRTVLRLAGQFADAVPAPGNGFFAAAGDAIVHLTENGLRVQARTPGRPFDLVANAAGGVDFLAGVGGRASVWHLGARVAIRAGGGVFHELALFNGRGGHTIAAGTTGLSPTAGILGLPRQSGQVEAVSLAGTAYSPAPAGSAGKRIAPGRDGALPGTPLVLSATRAPGERRVTSWQPASEAPPAIAMPGLPMSRATTTRTRNRAATASFTSTCAVPRNNVYLQAMQPSPNDVAWAANLAGRSLLTGSAARPADYANLGLPAYSPSLDFRLPAPFGPTGASIPREVLEGIFAQESNFEQASPHSVQGVAGNPLIADYYGAKGGDIVGVTTPDCGYGLGQVTTDMHTGEMSYNLQRKVAVDYAENVAASAQILAEKWNELKAAGITANSADPQHLENWYLALWDYNSGLHPNKGSGPWGLGWSNNPINPDYPYNRETFLVHWKNGDPVVTYGDAATPGNWPYQEKVFGWIEVPIRSPLTGYSSYNGTVVHYPKIIYADAFTLSLPGAADFCNKAKNQCIPTNCSRATYGSKCNPNTKNASGPCTNPLFECWWHFPDSWCDFQNPCNTGSWEYNKGDPEPPAQSTVYYPSPTCAVTSTDIPPGTDIVDSQPTAVNLQGCTPADENWHNNGSFAFSYGDPAVKNSQQTDMDVHQLGTGLGGHIWFTHTNEPTDADGVSLWGVTGTWTPNIVKGRYQVKVFIPSAGASATQANYTVSNGLGFSRTVTVDQNAYSDKWVSLGYFWLGLGSTVSLTNLHVTSGGDLAFSGVAFVPAPDGIYAMLGDSYSSGEGAGDYDPETDNYKTTQGYNNGHRSPYAANRVFATASVPFGDPANRKDVACSGAVIADFYKQNPKGRCPNEYGQMTALNSSTSLVTLSFGGNDLGFGKIVRDCVIAGVSEHFKVLPYAPCAPNDNSLFQQNLAKLKASGEGGLPQLFADIRTGAPNADVVVMGYPHLLIGPTPTSAGRCATDGWILDSDQKWLNGIADQIDSVVKAAAKNAGFFYISTTADFTGHEFCTSDPWFNGLGQPTPDTFTGWMDYINGSLPRIVQQWFHPNVKGYAHEAFMLQNAVQVPVAAKLPPE